MKACLWIFCHTGDTLEEEVAKNGADCYLHSILLESSGKRPKPMSRVLALVPYKDQKVLYHERLLRLTQKLGCHAEYLVDTSSIGGFLGRESSVVILDLVRTEGLGFQQQERRMAVAFSRCCDSFIMC